MPSHFCQQAKLITVFWVDNECHYRRPLQKPKSNFKIESWKSVSLKVKNCHWKGNWKIWVYEKGGGYVFITIMLQYFHLGVNVSSTVKITFSTTSTFERRLHENVFKKIIETYYFTISIILSCTERHPVKRQLLLNFRVWQVYCLSFCPTTFIHLLMLFYKVSVFSIIVS